ncbi:MAG: septal ring lytic transglycosylase RlpA family protein [Rhodospirillaceae bacterium]
MIQTAFQHRKRLAPILCLFGALALGACAEAQLAATGVKTIGKAGTPSPGKGTYKVGKPYEINGKWYHPKEDNRYEEVGEASWYGPNFHGKRTANGDIYDQWAMTAAHPTLPMPSQVTVTNLSNGRTVSLTINDRGPFASNRIIDVSRAAARALGFEKQGTTRVRVTIDAQESARLKAAALGRSSSSVAQRNTRPASASQSAAARPASQSAPQSQAQPVQVAQMEDMAQSRSQYYAARPTQTDATQQPAVAGQGGSAGSQPSQTAATTPQTQTATVQTASTYTPPPTAIPVAAGGAAAASVSGALIQVGSFANEANALRMVDDLSSFGAVQVTQVALGDHLFHRVRIGPYADGQVADQALRRLQESGYPQARLVLGGS